MTSMDYNSFLEAWHNDKNHIKVRTSGSTGKPKELRLDKEMVRQSAMRTITFFSLNADSVFYSCISPDFIGGKMMAVRADLCGGKLIWEEPSNQPIGIIDLKERIDLLAVVPSQMLWLLENIEKLPEIKNIIVGGAPLNNALVEKISNSGLNVYETYGMTETASHIALKKVEHGIIHFTVLDGIEVFTDKRGCLGINFANGFQVITNDLAEIHSPKEFKIIGRIDDVIITGGMKVHPAEVESRISDLIKYPFVITSEEDIKWGRRIVLKIEGKEDSCLSEEIITNLKTSLLPHQVPKKILWVEKLEKTPGGKLKR